MDTFDELHFFLEESGDLAVDPALEPVMLVGGVLLFGPYTEADDRYLHGRLEKHITDEGGVYPRDAHYYESWLRRDGRLDKVLAALATDLQDWGRQGHPVCGVHIVHHRDFRSRGPHNLIERDLDNRYVLMLWSLVEHILFVDQEIYQHLAPRARLHLHVSHRTYVFDPLQVPPETVTKQGYDVVTRRGKKKVFGILTPGDVRGMLRIAFRDRWHHSRFELGSIEVPQLEYRVKLPQMPAALLYLADLYLGKVRDAMRTRSTRIQLGAEAAVVPPFRQLGYEERLELMALMEGALHAPDVERYLALAREYAAFPDAPYELIRKRQEAAVAKLLAQSPAQVIGLLEEGCRTVDQPGRARVGLDMVERAAGYLQAGGAPRALRAEVLTLQAQLSYANHTGDVNKAAKIWEEYLACEAELLAGGPEGWKLVLEIRNRWAVSLTDRFLYGAAEHVLNQILAAQTTMMTNLTSQLRKKPRPGTNYELGTCYGTLGQIYAFQGTPDKQDLAEKQFRQALELFTEPADQERQWVYLGHLACDRREAGRPLWDEVGRHLAGLTSCTPLTRPGSQYVLALQIKGLGVFGETVKLLEFLEHWEGGDPLKEFSLEERGLHPFGLIEQGLAMLHVRAATETRAEKHANFAFSHFENAFQNLRKGGALLEALASLSKLRRRVFDLERRHTPATKQHLTAAFREVQGRLAEFGEHVWGEEEDGRSHGIFGQGDLGQGQPWMKRARGVLEAVRFNYW